MSPVRLWMLMVSQTGCLELSMEKQVAVRNI